jgi:hypothetical protein
MQLEAPTLGLKVPEGQGEQLEAASREYFPDTQPTQTAEEAAPVVDKYVPAEQVKQCN